MRSLELGGVRTTAVALALIFAAIYQGANELGAQDAAVDGGAAAEGGEAAAVAQRTWGEELFKAPQKTSEWVGVGFYIVLLIFSVVAATVTLERLVRLTRERVLPAAFVGRLNELARSGQDTESNFRSLAASSNSLVAVVLQAALVRAGRPLLEVEKGMEDALVREISSLRGRHRALSVLGNVAPLVGLFGTVVGIMFAFGVVSQAGLGKAELMADGINVALRTTAMGLTIAVPCMLLVAWFNARIDRYTREIDEALLQTLPGFARMEQDRRSAPVVAESANGEERSEAEQSRTPVSAK